eukprot:gene6734-7444_t
MKTCQYLRAEQREEESLHAGHRKVITTEHSSDISPLSSSTTSVQKKVFITIIEHVYECKQSYTLKIIRNGGLNNNNNNNDNNDTTTTTAMDPPHEKEVILTQRTNKLEITSRMKSPPIFDQESVHTVRIDWIFDLLSNFRINREALDCHTPSNNKEVNTIAEEVWKLKNFLHQVVQDLIILWDLDPTSSSINLTNLDWVKSANEQVFIPIVAFLQEIRNQQSTPPFNESHSTSTSSYYDVLLWSSEELQILSKEQRRGLANVLEEVKERYPDDKVTQHPINRHQASLILLLKHSIRVSTLYLGAVSYIEEMLRQQVIAAIGRTVTSYDMNRYMSFHYHHLYQPAFSPKPWSVAVRRSQLHSPEGDLRLEVDLVNPLARQGQSIVPVETYSISSNATLPMSFPINAATRIKFTGKRHLHGWLHHEFATSGSPSTPRLIATARQFSSYIVLLGQISSTTTFEPKYAFIIKNKEELTIPLSMEILPNAKQFREAISSLSPEQQAFAKAFRAMQLESTLFGIVTVQIKPQLEKVLNLQPDSLTKEIKLTQDLMDLFIDYQIPADLLSFDESTKGSDGSSSVTGEERLMKVKEHVKQMKAMLADLKGEEVNTKQTERAFTGSSTSCPSAYSIRIPSGSPTSCPSSVPTSCPSSVPTSCPSSVPTSCPTGSPATSANLRGGGTTTNHADFSHRVLVDDLSFPSVNEEAGGETTETAKEPMRPEDYSTDVMEDESIVGGAALIEYYKFPQLLDNAFDGLDTSHAVQPAILHVREDWQRRKPQALAMGKDAKPLELRPSSNDLQNEKEAAFELLDALTRSGGLLIEHADLYVIVTAVHSFADSVMDTLVHQNINPIEHIEQSSLIMASTLYKHPAQKLIQSSQVSRFLDRIQSTESSRPDSSQALKKILGA